MDLRLSSMQIISSALICAFSFGFEFKKHHKVSLIIISIVLLLSIGNDMLFMVLYEYKNIRVPIFQYFISLYYYIGFSFNNCIEKYLVDVDYMNPFLILMLEGIFQLILALLTIIWFNPFNIFEHKNMKNNLALFIPLFILFILLQIVVNIYRIYCNVIYSPMARSLIDFFLNPFINIFFFFIENEFFKNGVYFGVTEVLCCIMSFFGCVFNEYIVLYCCGLERETQDEIADRAQIRENEKQINEKELKIISDNEDSEIDEIDTNINYFGTYLSLDDKYHLKI